MSLIVFFAVLLAALMHASWNAVIKFGADKVQGMMLLTFAQALTGFFMALFVPLPSAETWVWLAGSIFIHALYQTFVAMAYSHGDLSRVYPISRGTAPLLVLIFGFFALPDMITRAEYLGVTVLGLGIVLMARGIFANGESRRLLPFAFGAACATAGYSITDGMGARVSGDATVYIAWLMMGSFFTFTPVCVAMRGWQVFRMPPRVFLLGGLAGFLSVMAYWIVVWAMTQAPIALVAALRETSILFAVLIGVLFFGDRADRTKLVAAVVIVAGVVLTRI